MPFLTSEQIQFFHDNGYLVIPDFWNDETIDQIKTRILELVNQADLSNVKSVFSTKENMRKSDDYFLNSGGDIRYFWEEKAWENDELKYSKELAINKIGHALHDLEPIFEKASYDGRIGSMCEELGMEKPIIAQSMYIFKQPKIGGLVVPHQDGTFLYTEPQSCIGFWVPINDCSKTNGCLWAVPGSHKLGVHRRYRRKDPPAEGTEFVPVEPVEWDISTAVPLEIKRGTLVVLHAALVHHSYENNSDLPRHAYTIHIIDGKEGIVYPADNWLQRPPEFPFRILTNRV